MELDQYKRSVLNIKLVRHTFHKWRYNYEKYGIDGLKESKKCKKYSKELKEQAFKTTFQENTHRWKLQKNMKYQIDQYLNFG